MSSVDRSLARALGFKGDGSTIKSIVESDEPLVALKDANRLSLRPIWAEHVDEIEGLLYLKYIDANPGYSEIWVRQPLALMLKQAASLLSNSMGLIVRAGHRPLGVQKALLNMLVVQFKQDNPGASDKQALEFARTYVSDPDLKLPPHCCGAAVDVDVMDLKSGKLIDFGCSVNTDSEVAFLNTNLVSGDQRQNRMQLLRAMLGAGFAPHPNEWWHFSYGDQIWAEFYNKKQALYGIIEPNLERNENER